MQQDCVKQVHECDLKTRQKNDPLLGKRPSAIYTRSLFVGGAFSGMNRSSRAALRSRRGGWQARRRALDEDDDAMMVEHMASKVTHTRFLVFFRS